MLNNIFSAVINFAFFSPQNITNCLKNTEIIIIAFSVRLDPSSGNHLIHSQMSKKQVWQF